MAKRPCGGLGDSDVAMHDQQSIQTRDITTALKVPIRSLREAVARLEAGLVGDVQLRSITVSLISTWRLIERDPGFEVAAADLLAAARELARISHAGEVHRGSE